MHTMALFLLLSIHGDQGQVDAQEIARIPFGFGDSSIGDFVILPNGAVAVCGVTGWAAWDCRTSRLVSTCESCCYLPGCVAASPDGQFLVVGGNALGELAQLKVFSPKSGKLLADLGGHRLPLRNVAFSRDGKYLVSLSEENNLRVWENATWKPLLKCCFTSDPARIQSQIRNQWKPMVDRPQDKAKIDVVNESVIFGAEAFAISPDGLSIAVTTGTKRVLFLDTLTGKVRDKIRCKNIRHSLAVAFSQDGQFVAIGGAGDGLVEIWDRKRGTLFRTLEKHLAAVISIAISPNNRYVVSGGNRDGARVWDLQSGKLLFRLQHDVAEEPCVRKVAFTPDGHGVVTSCDSDRLRFWDLKTGKMVAPSVFQWAP